MLNNTVMIVDDSPTDSHLICNALADAGYETLAINNADEALSIAKNEKPGVIVMDIVMPGTNGFQATRQLRNDPDTADIPIIIVSSKNKASDRVWGLRQGAVAYLTKPVSTKDLIEKLGDLKNRG